MFPLTEPPSSADPAPQQTAAAMTTELGGGNTPASAAMNPYLDLWLEAIVKDRSLPREAYAVASVMARSVGIGRVAFTDWQRINATLGRNRRDLAVFEVMSELALEGYLDRNIDERFGRNYGWLLLIPGGDL
jgi:hypothetical protein